MIVPVGERYEQTLYLFRKIDGKLEKVALLPTLFVPMTGKAEDSRVAKPDPANPQINNGGFEEVSAPPAESSKTDPDEIKAEKPTIDKPPKDSPSDADKFEPTPLGWHYQRQLKLVEGDEAPQGQHYFVLIAIGQDCIQVLRGKCRTFAKALNRGCFVTTGRGSFRCSFHHCFRRW